jgi:DNA-binding protein HU-alpha
MARTSTTRTPRTKAATGKSGTPSAPSARKPAAPASKPAPAAEAPAQAPAPVEATVVAPARPVVAGPVLRKKDLVDRVVARSGLKKKDVKPAVEALLEELGLAVSRGEELNLPPFGKLKVTREKETANARVLNCRIRQPRSAMSPNDPLAKPAD